MSRIKRTGTERYAERRILETPVRHALRGKTRVPSPRQLPTNHDCVGEPQGSIHEYQGDRPSSTAAPVLVRMVLQERDEEGRKRNRSQSY